MKITIYQRITEKDVMTFEVQTKLIDENGEILDDKKREFNNANGIYAAFKTLQSSIAPARRFGATSLALDTNMESIKADLERGNSVNSTLLFLTRDKLDRFGLIIEEITYNEDN